MRWLLTTAAVLTAFLTPSAGTPAAEAAATETFGVIRVLPGPGEVVGVAHPVVVQFIAPVVNRKAAERTVAITTSQSTTGEFTWLDATTLEWMPTGYWPAHDRIEVRAGGLKTEFSTGAAVVGIADIDAHTFTVEVDGEVVREMPASLGKPGFETPVGDFTVLEKQRNVVFDSRTIGIPLDDPEGYLIDGEFGVRVTWGGVYVHSAPWSVDAQGAANVSHGCINLSPENAEWYFDMVRVGDPVTVQA